MTLPLASIKNNILKTLENTTHIPKGFLSCIIFELHFDHFETSFLMNMGNEDLLNANALTISLYSRQSAL